MVRRAVAVCLSLLAAVLAGSCAPADETATEPGVVRAELSAAQRLARATIIRDAAARRGLTNGVLLGGIADSETGMAHCWSEATWACQGPSHSDCGGPVIAGAGDGPCSLRQGGLGMFQFDAGTYDDTLAREGDRVLSIAGNTDAAVDFVVSMVTRSTFIDGVDNAAQALAWMNEVRVDGRHWDAWITTVTAYYNGCWPGRCSVYASRYDRYASHTRNILREMGEGFWYPPACEAHCEGSVLVNADCSSGDCAPFGSDCVDDALGPRCVFHACPPVGTTEVCVSDSVVGSCVDGALVSQDDCAALGALCTSAGGQTPHCASMLCVGAPDEVPVEQEVCFPDGQRYRCDASGSLVAADCPAGERCSVHPEVHCEAELPCPAAGEVLSCYHDLVVRCSGGGVVEVVGDCVADGGLCTPTAEGEARCVSALCADRPGGAPIEREVCLPDGTVGTCSAEGEIVDRLSCPAGLACAELASGPVCLESGDEPEGGPGSPRGEVLPGLAGGCSLGGGSPRAIPALAARLATRLLPFSAPRPARPSRSSPETR